MTEVMTGAKLYIGVGLARLSIVAVIFAVIAVVYAVVFLCLWAYDAYKRK